MGATPYAILPICIGGGNCASGVEQTNRNDAPGALVVGRRSVMDVARRVRAIRVEFLTMAGPIGWDWIFLRLELRQLRQCSLDISRMLDRDFVDDTALTNGLG